MFGSLASCKGMGPISTFLFNLLIGAYHTMIVIDLRISNMLDHVIHPKKSMLDHVMWVTCKPTKLLNPSFVGQYMITHIFQILRCLVIYLSIANMLDHLMWSRTCKLIKLLNPSFDGHYTTTFYWSKSKMCRSMYSSISGLKVSFNCILCTSTTSLLILKLEFCSI